MDTPLSDALYNKPLIFTLVHFSEHNLAILDIYLSALFQFVHFSGHTFTSFDIYLSALFQFVHFSGRTAFILFKYNIPVKSYSFMRIFILLLADRPPFIACPL